MDKKNPPNTTVWGINVFPDGITLAIVTAATATVATTGVTTPAIATATTITTSTGVAPLEGGIILRTGERFFYNDLTTLEFRIVQPSNSLLARVFIFHFDKSKAPATASFPVGNNFYGSHRAVGLKNIFQIFLRDAPGKIRNIKVHLTKNLSESLLAG